MKETSATQPRLSTDGILDAAIRHFAARHDAVLSRTLSSESFELWLNSEFVAACQGAGLIAVNEAGYATFGVQTTSEMPDQSCADILLIDPQSMSHWLLEGALVGANTQSKWRKKIKGDAIKLRKVSRPGVRKFILLYCVSAVEKVFGDGPQGAWDGWLAPVMPLCTSRAEQHRDTTLGTEGQLALRLWEVQ